MSEAKCVKSVVDGWHWRACGKPAKGADDKGNPLCGIHLGGWRRSQAVEERRRQRREEDSARRKREDEERVRLAAATAALGLTGLDSASLEALAAEVAALRAELAAYRERDRWIPVEERLPEDGQVVIMAIHGSPHEVDVISGDLLAALGATHWRPLPPLHEVAKDGAT